MSKKFLILLLAGFVGIGFVSTVYSSFFVNEYPSLSFQKKVLSEQTGTHVVGAGTTPSSALKDGIRQIRELFGTHFISSETVVREGVLEKDVIIEKGSFCGSKLDWFYEGVFCSSNNKFFAVFRFPTDFVEAVRLKGKERDKGFSKFFASFDAMTANDGWIL